MRIALLPFIVGVLCHCSSPAPPPEPPIAPDPASAPAATVLVGSECHAVDGTTNDCEAVTSSATSASASSPLRSSAASSTVSANAANTAATMGARPTAQAASKPAPSAPPATAAATANKGFALPPDFRTELVLAVKDELFYAESGKVGRIKRSGEELAHRGPQKPVSVRGFADAVVVVGNDGGIARYQRGAWEYRLAPALEGEDIAASIVGKDGKLYVAGKHHALYTLEGDVWSTVRYGTTGVDVGAMAFAKDGSLVLVGSHGRVLTFAGGTFTDTNIQGLAAALASPWLDFWTDDDGGVVWVALTKSLLAIDVNAKTATEHRSALFFDHKAVSGAHTKQGVLLVVSTFADCALFDGKDFYQGGEDGDSVTIDVASAIAVSSERPQTMDLLHPWLGTGPGTVMPLR